MTHASTASIVNALNIYHCHQIEVNTIYLLAMQVIYHYHHLYHHISLTFLQCQCGVEVPQIYIGPPEDAKSKYPGYQSAVSTLVGFDYVYNMSGSTKNCKLHQFRAPAQLLVSKQSDLGTSSRSTLGMGENGC